MEKQLSVSRPLDLATCLVHQHWFGDAKSCFLSLGSHFVHQVVATRSRNHCHYQPHLWSVKSNAVCFQGEGAESQCSGRRLRTPCRLLRERNLPSRSISDPVQISYFGRNNRNILTKFDEPRASYAEDLSYLGACRKVETAFALLRSMTMQTEVRDCYKLPHATHQTTR